MNYNKEHPVGKVRLENGIIQDDALSPLLFVLTVDPLTEIMKRKYGNEIEILYSIDDLKIRVNDMETAKDVYLMMKRLCQSTGMVLNIKKNGIDTEEDLPEELQELTRI